MLYSFNSTIKEQVQEIVVIKGRLALEQTKEKCREKTTTKFNKAA